MPNIVTIDKIDKLLDGKHPDTMGDIKFRFRMGLFLAKPKKDPLTRAFLHGSLMEKAYDFDIPEDISEIPDETPEEIEGKEHIGMKTEKEFGHSGVKTNNFSVRHGMTIQAKDKVKQLYEEVNGPNMQTSYSYKPGGLPSDNFELPQRSSRVQNPEDLEGRVFQKLQ